MICGHTSTYRHCVKICFFHHLSSDKNHFVFPEFWIAQVHIDINSFHFSLKPVRRALNDINGDKAGEFNYDNDNDGDGTSDTSTNINNETGNLRNI